MAALFALGLLVLMAQCQAHSPLDEKSSGNRQTLGARTGRAAGSNIHGTGCFFHLYFPSFMS